MKNIFITGATGFLGWDLAKNLLEDRDSKLYLLTRADADQAAKERINSLVKKSYSGSKRKDMLNRIEVVEGDISEQYLGINKSILDKLHNKIDVIYHCAALCKFGVPLEDIRRINVMGTKRVLDFAFRCKEKGRFTSFHHISTIAVLGDFGGTFYESSLNLNQRFNNNYEQTKFEAEKLIEEYRKRGLSISLYRPSIITGHSITGEVYNFRMFYQPLHIFSLQIFDEIPANKVSKCNLVPVDYVAKAISLISSNQDNNKNYHLTNPNTITLDALLNMASSYFGFKKPKIIPEKEFDFKELAGFRRKLLDPYLPYFNHVAVEFDTTNFNKAIEGKGFSWPVIDNDLLLRLFKYCVDVKYIRRHR